MTNEEMSGAVFFFTLGGFAAFTALLCVLYARAGRVK